jgi:hypothetical protein
LIVESVGEVAALVAKTLVTRQERQRDRVIDHGLHALCLQVPRQRVALFMPDHEQVIHVFAVRGGERDGDSGDAGQQLGVAARDLLAPRGPGAQVR